MATVTALVKIKNKDRDENPLWVVFRHQKLEVVVSTGESLSPKLLKKGKVIGDRALVLNELIATIGSDLQKAYDTVTKRAEGLSSADVKQEFERLDAERKTKLKWDKFLHKDEEYTKNQRIGHANRRVYRAKKQLEEIQAEMAYWAKQYAELSGTVTSLEDEKKEYLTTYIQRYTDERMSAMARSTKSGYNAVCTAINAYNPTLKLKDVTLTIMREIEAHLLTSDTQNTTIVSYMGKIKAVCNFYASEAGMTSSYKMYECELPTQPNDVVYLTVKQLEDFWNHEKQALIHEKQPGRTAPKKSYIQVRDMFMFMCATALRYSDLFQGDFRDFIQSETLEDGTVEEHLVMFPRKTRKKSIKVMVPVTPIVKDILERNDYKFKRMKDSFFRDLLREYCNDIPSFQAPVTKFELKGTDRSTVKNEYTGEKIKFWEAIGSHTGRRTWTNFAFQSGWLIPEIAGVTGHISLNTLMTYASKVKVVKSAIKPLDTFHRLNP
ncbi:phage integrase SAM-like domain-containing protein [Hymenobacter sp. BT683]|uniref:Phage integrase SAM-like domain-containing protein n=1 Tax=Hymenobacter jeongseonensis TaxID=2791027 RepID=A0ABS0IGJ3_9BACT|nr:phage integrase SAM-like domain-containing protein [Hymenobacter jeongseonensis]MBF9237472.1 phage integrase SAM-like domain-containing protein [Hymenobacter jeongseonensis]